MKVKTNNNSEIITNDNNPNMPDNSSIKIGIIGNGPVGQAFSVSLSSAGYDVEVAGRRQRGIKIDDSFAYEIIGDFGDKTYLVNVVSDISQFTEKKDIIIVATRLFDTPRAAKNAMSMLKPNGAIVTIQNWICLDKVMKAIPPENSVGMILNFTCILNDDVVRVIDTNGIDLGVYDKDAFDKLIMVKKVFSTFCTVNTTNDIMGFVLSRNVLNSAIALLGAVSGLRLGEFLSIRKGRRLFCKCIIESMAILNKLNIKVLPYNNHLDYYKFTEKSLSGLFYRHEIIKLLKKNNKHIKSSALEEIESGKKCELEQVLTGIIAHSRVLGLKNKYLNALYEILKEIIEGKRGITPEVFNDVKLK